MYEAHLLRPAGPKPTLAVSYFHRLYDGGAPEFDFDSPSNSLLLLASADVKHYDANAFFTELVKDPVRRGQFEQSLTISHPFLKNFTLSGEIWHFTQPFLQRNAVGILWPSATRHAKGWSLMPASIRASHTRRRNGRSSLASRFCYPIGFGTEMPSNEERAWCSAVCRIM
jgi:hypothetical protein